MGIFINIRINRFCKYLSKCFILINCFYMIGVNCCKKDNFCVFILLVCGGVVLVIVMNNCLS